MQHRYQGQLQETRPETYCIMDTMTGTTVAKDITDAESAQERVDQLNKDYAEVAEVVDRVTRFVNRGGAPKDFVAAMSTEHRTLQQGFTRVVVAWIEHLAKVAEQGSGWYDGRNEDSVKLGKALVALPEWDNIRYLRHI